MKNQDIKIIEILGEHNITDIRRLICNTNKGVLELAVRKGEGKYFLTLDSVPLEKEMNDKLMDLLFKPEIPTVNKVAEATQKVLDNAILDYIAPKKKEVIKPKTKKVK